MTPQDIQKDREARTSGCKAELETILQKYQFGLLAEDNWTPNTKIKVDISFVDLKKYDTQVAEPSPVVVPVPETPITSSETK